LAGGLYKFYANDGGKPPIQRQPDLMQYKQQSNPLLSMHNNTPLEINGMTLDQQQYLKTGRVPSLGLELTMHLIKSQINLVIQYL
jgi:hypothetical protein